MTKSFIFEPSILKQYDIRGVVDKNLSNEVAYYVGRSYGTLLARDKNKHSCIVGYDGRHTSVSYTENVIKGLRECGIDVINIGLVPTPMVYFAVQYLKKDAGIIITASHNPPEYNGFKMLTNEDPIFGDDIQKLGVIAKNADFVEGNGNLEEKDLKEDYLNFLLSKLNKNNKKTLNIVWDAGNGAVAAVLNDFVSKLPGKNKTLYADVDGDFPNHHPDPSISEYMQDLKNEVLNGHYDLGIGFDGDGDRLGIIDSEGYIFYGDQMLMIFARDFLKDNPGEKVMSEVSASQVLYDDIKNHGGIPVVWKPGHSSQKAKMKSDNIKLAGETSCHIFFGENYNYDDSLYASVKLINILANSDETLAEMRKKFPTTYITKKIHLKSNNEDKVRVPKEIAERIRKQGREVINVEGARVNKADGWWLIRNSNTGPEMTARCEALSKEGLEECKKELKEQLKTSGYDINFDN